MRFRPCTVSVTQLPETVNIERGRRFFKELESRMNIDRPCIVLDCSKVREMDRFAIHMLLCCLEEAMKRDGDVKLAAVSPSAREALEMTRVDRLFEIYATETEAVNSFFRPSFENAFYAGGAGDADDLSESAA
ncbi:MAG TPA: STAS domain-containing protein [Terracidiphilus sp.]